MGFLLRFVEDVGALHLETVATQKERLKDERELDRTDEHGSTLDRAKISAYSTRAYATDSTQFAKGQLFIRQLAYLGNIAQWRTLEKGENGRGKAACQGQKGELIE